MICKLAPLKHWNDSPPNSQYCYEPVYPSHIFVYAKNENERNRGTNYQENKYPEDEQKNKNQIAWIN